MISLQTNFFFAWRSKKEIIKISEREKKGHKRKHYFMIYRERQKTSNQTYKRIGKERERESGIDKKEK